VPEIKPALFVMHTRRTNYIKKARFCVVFVKKQFCIFFCSAVFDMLCNVLEKRFYIFPAGKSKK